MLFLLFMSACLSFVQVTNWRKGGPWLGLTRTLASRLVADVRLFDAFADCCLPEGMAEEGEGEGEGEDGAEAAAERDGDVQQGGEGHIGQQESVEGGEGGAMNEGDGSSTLPRPAVHKRAAPVVRYPACFPAEHYFASALPMLADPLFAAMAAGAAAESELMSVPGYAEDAGVGGGRSEGGSHLLPWGNMWGGVEEVTNWSLVFEDWWTNAGSGYPATFLPNQVRREMQIRYAAASSNSSRRRNRKVNLYIFTTFCMPIYVCLPPPCIEVVGKSASCCIFQQNSVCVIEGGLGTSPSSVNCFCSLACVYPGRPHLSCSTL